MRQLFRHLVAALMPFTMVVIVPYLVLSSGQERSDSWAGGSPSTILSAGGAVVFLCGLSLFLWCLRLFIRVGRGTLAPWDPTRQLVAVGPYRYVRNPMISSVATMLLGESIFFQSRLLALWCCAFVAVNHIYFVLSEEPALEKRFGRDYREYKRSVPRWVPRLRH